MAITFLVGSHNDLASQSSLQVTMTQSITNGDTLIVVVDVTAASVTSITATANVGTFVNQASENTNGSSLWAVASALAGISNLVLSATFTGTVTNTSIEFLHYTGVLGGLGNTGTGSGKLASPNEKVVITKQAAANFIAACLMDKTTAGLASWNVNAGTTMRENGTGSATLLATAGVDDNGTGAVGSVSVGAIASGGSTTITWSACGIELKASAAAAGVLQTRTLLGVGRALSSKMREILLHRRVMFGFTSLKYDEPVFC